MMKIDGNELICMDMTVKFFLKNVKDLWKEQDRIQVYIS